MINHMEPTAEQKAMIDELMKAPFPVTVETIARKLNVTPLEAAQLLPAEVVTFVSGDAAERFDDIWAELASWDKVTMIITHLGHVIEVAGQLGTGKRAQGYYNIMGKDAAVGGHIRYDAMAAVGFMSLPFMGRESLSVQFFDKTGDVAFSVYVGRENHKLIESVKARFIKAREAFAA